MIRSLSGTITTIGDNAITLDVNGVGYLIATPTKTTTLTKHEQITMHTYLAVRETALDLYGFTTSLELEVFEMILNVPKIGPKSALQILTQASPTLLIETITNNDHEQLHKLSGIGKKTCENIVQALHKKIEKYGFAVETEMPKVDADKTDAIDALISLGYDLGTARAIVSEMADDLSTNELITQALKKL